MKKRQTPAPPPVDPMAGAYAEIAQAITSGAKRLRRMTASRDLAIVFDAIEAASELATRFEAFSQTHRTVVSLVESVREIERDLERAKESEAVMTDALKRVTAENRDLQRLLRTFDDDDLPPGGGRFDFHHN